MIIKKLKDNITGEVHTFNFEKEPTEEDLKSAINQVLASETNTTPGATRSFENEPQTAKDYAKSVAAGLLEGGTLGLSNLVPKLKEFTEKEQSKNPMAFTAGDVGSYLIPFTGAGKAIKAGTAIGKVISKGAQQLLERVGAEKLGGVVGSNIASRVAGGATSGAITGGVSGATNEGGIDIEQGLKSAGKGALLGGVTEGATSVASKALGGLSQKLYRSAIKPLKKTDELGFKEENIVKYNLDKGSFKQIDKKADNILDKAENEKKIIIDKANINKEFLVPYYFKVAKKEITETPPSALFGNKDEALRALDKIQEHLGDMGKGFSGDVKDLDKIRQLVGDFAYPKTREMTREDAVKSNAAKVLYKYLVNDLKEAAPDLKKVFETISEVKPIQNAARQAEQRFGKRDYLGLRDLIILSSGLTGMGVSENDREIGAGTVALIAANKLLSKGRSASYISKLSKTAQSNIPEKLSLGIMNAYPQNVLDEKKKYRGLK